jgi:sugar lactone lactonase YvrE
VDEAVLRGLVANGTMLAQHKLTAYALRMNWEYPIQELTTYGSNSMALIPKVCCATVLALVASALLSGCGPKPIEEPREAIFYPALPDEPRLQFLTSFNSAEPWVTKQSDFREFVTGQTRETDSGWMKSPYGVAAHRGKLYICDLGRKRVHVIDAAEGTYSFLGDQRTFRNPVNIAIGPDGKRYVCDTGASRVFVYDTNDRLITTFGDGKKFVPGDLAISGDEIYIANMRDGRVEVLAKDGTHLRSISSKGNGPDQLRMPTNLDVGPDGNIFVSDTFLQVVKVFSPKGDFLRTIGRPGDRPGNFARPKGIAISSPGHVYVVDAQWEKIQVFRPDGQLLLFLGDPGPNPESLGLPAGIAVDTTSVEAFGRFISNDFEAEYLILVASQFWQEGRGKVNVYAYGHRKGVTHDD